MSERMEQAVSLQGFIYEIRNQRVMLDKDLAELYGVQTKVLLQSIRRNLDRFPEDFMFQLEYHEFKSLRSQLVTSSLSHGGRRYLPYAFTEQGVAMLSSVLKSKKAVQVNIEIMRTFVRTRKVIASHKVGLEKLTGLEQIQKIHGHLLHEHDDNIAIIFDAIRRMEDVPEKEKRKIGFMK